MSKKKTILFLPGDGIGPEVSNSAKNILELVNEIYDLGFTIEETQSGTGGRSDKEPFSEG